MDGSSPSDSSCSGSQVRMNRRSKWLLTGNSPNREFLLSHGACSHGKRACFYTATASLLRMTVCNPTGSKGLLFVCRSHSAKVSVHRTMLMLGSLLGWIVVGSMVAQLRGWQVRSIATQAIVPFQSSTNIALFLLPNEQSYSHLRVVVTHSRSLFSQ